VYAALLLGNANLQPIDAPSDPVLEFAPGPSLDAQYHVPFQGARIIEPRLGLARASRWTTIPITDTVFRVLLEIYLVNYHPMLTFFHKDFFLDDLVSGREEHCSSLLVNAILALAAVSEWGGQWVYCDAKLIRHSTATKASLSGPNSGTWASFATCSCPRPNNYGIVTLGSKS